MTASHIVELYDEDGYKCMIRKIPLGVYCGYVGVTEEHPYYGQDIMGGLFGFLGEGELRVHGGVTYCDKMPESDHWWIGFDCAHFGDYVPGLGSIADDGVFRDIPYVKREITRLVEQIKEAA